MVLYFTIVFTDRFYYLMGFGVTLQTCIIYIDLCTCDKIYIGDLNVSTMTKPSETLQKHKIGPHF